LRPYDALTEAEDLITQGRRMDENFVMLHNTFAMLRMFQWRWEESEAAFRRGIELEPDNPHVRMMYSHLCYFRGRQDGAVRGQNGSWSARPGDQFSPGQDLLLRAAICPKQWPTDERLSSWRPIFRIPVGTWLGRWSKVPTHTRDDQLAQELANLWTE
jgi:hypothetical protein